jgi:hypothetical protein
LKAAGITVNDRRVGNNTRYSISIDGMPDAEDYMETTFNSITDIVLAFADKLRTKQIKVIA